MSLFRILGLLALILALRAEVLVHPLAPCFTTSGIYRVEVDGQAVPVRVVSITCDGQERLQYLVAHASVRGTVRVTVESAATGSWTLRPSDYGIATRVAGERLSFVLDRSRYLQLRLGEAPILYLLMDPWEDDAPTAGDGTVTTLLPPADGVPVHEAIQRALDGAHARGGGTVQLAPGVHPIMRGLQLRSGVRLHLVGGAVLMAAGPGFVPVGEGALLLIKDGVGVRLSGRGTVWCNAYAVNGGQPYQRHEQKVPGSLNLRPIQVRGASREVVIGGVILQESVSWSVTAWDGAAHLRFHDLKLLNDREVPWNDGIDICGAEDVLIEHVFITGCDDGICLKAASGPVRRVVMRDLVLSSTVGAGFKLGMQASHDIQQVAITDAQVLEGCRGFALDHWYGDGTWSDVTIRHCRVEALRKRATRDDVMVARGYYDVPFRIEVTGKDSRAWTRVPTRGVGTITRVLLEDIRFAPGTSGPVPPYIQDKTGSATLAGITIRGLWLDGRPVTRIADSGIRVGDRVRDFQLLPDGP